jgi:ketosteroid isomerase-like protein
MSTPSSVTENVVRNHLQAFLTGQGIDAILNDYDDGARFYSEDHVYQGKQEIRRFFTQFMGTLPPCATDRFALRSLRVHGTIAFITWSVGSDIPLGTDTFVVEDGKIVSQTYAMYAVPASGGIGRGSL